MVAVAHEALGAERWSSRGYQPYSTLVPAKSADSTVQAHKVETQHPDFHPLMVARQRRPGQVIKLLLTAVAAVALTGRLLRVKAPFRDPVKASVQAMDAIWPS